MRTLFRKLLVPILLVLLFIYGSILKDTHFKQTIKFFPIDESIKFHNANTHLSIHQTYNKEWIMIWNVKSQSEVPLYLRQDISLIYKDGEFLGALSEWKENAQDLALQDSFPVNIKDHLYQAISFHHGEVHNQGEIRSIQTMSYDKLYTFLNNEKKLLSFHEPKTTLHKDQKKTVDSKIQEKLTTKWSELLKAYKLEEKDYDLIPLTELYQYQDHNLPGLSKDQTEKVVGQLWEGIYKSYLIPITREGQPASHIMPLILFSKDRSHLFVVFEFKGKKHQLIQNISSNNSI